MTEHRLFKPRDKDVDCEHWVDCRQKAVWAAEIEIEDRSYFEFFCEEHKEKFVKEMKDEQ